MTFLKSISFSSPNKNHTLPDFIIIGAMKCGTTSLHYYLNCHPEISMSRQKELDFFIEERNWNKGVDWYQSQFKSQEGVICGEASPHYTSYPIFKGIPERLYDTLPHVKLIYIIRDPIERILSQYIHLYAEEREHRNIEEALMDFEENPNNPYICRSRYYFQLEQYLSYFPSEQILLITTENLAKFPNKTLKNIFKFLGVNENFDMNQVTKKKLHQTKDKRCKTSFGNFISHLPIIQNINKLPSSIRFRLNKMIYRPFSQPVEQPILNKNLYDRLYNYLKEDIEKLRDYMEGDLKKWTIG